MVAHIIIGTERVSEEKGSAVLLDLYDTTVYRKKCAGKWRIMINKGGGRGVGMSKWLGGGIWRWKGSRGLEEGNGHWWGWWSEEGTSEPHRPH